MRRRAGRFGLEIINVNIWEHRDAREEAAHFCEVHGIGGTVLLDESGEYAEQLGIRGVPMNVLVDRDGVVRQVGATTPDEIRKSLTNLFLGRR